MTTNTYIRQGSDNKNKNTAFTSTVKLLTDNKDKLNKLYKRIITRA